MNKIVTFLIVFLFFFSQTAPSLALEYDFTNTDVVRIPLRISDKITTSKYKKSYEGQKLHFLVDKDVYFKNKILVKKGEVATARLEIITTRGFAGVPAEIFITDFFIPNIDSNKIIQPISKRGFSTTTLILPIKWALTPFPPFGSLTNIAIGGNASISPRKVIYVEYYPNYKFEK